MAPGTHSLSSYLCRPGDDFYYATRKTAPETQYATRVFYAYWAELIKISEHYQEPTIAKAKLAWWFEDVARIYQQQAQHPINQALTPLVARYEIRQSVLAAFIEAATLTIDTQLFPTWESLAHHFQHLGGLKCAWLATFLLGKKPDTDLEKALHLLGIGQEYCRHLMVFAPLLARGHLYLPEGLLQAQNLNAYQILQAPMTTELTACFQAFANEAQKTLTQALTQLQERKEWHQIKLKPLRIYTRYQQARLQLLQKKNFPVLHTCYDLSPIRKLGLSLKA